jgi:hypothetical protein
MGNTDTIYAFIFVIKYAYEFKILIVGHNKTIFTDTSVEKSDVYVSLSWYLHFEVFVDRCVFTFVLKKMISCIAVLLFTL